MSVRMPGVESTNPFLPSGVVVATSATVAQISIGTATDKLVAPPGLASKLPYLDVAAYGAVGDGTTDDTSAIQAALTAAGALVSGGSSLDKFRCPVRLRHGKTYRAVGLSVPFGVILDGNGSKIHANAAGTIVTLAGHHASIENTCLWGVGGSTANLGIYVTTAMTRCLINHCTFDSMGGRAILVEGLTTWVNNCMAQGCLILDSALGVPTGVLEINTTDCWITNSEFTASNSAMSASGFAYAVVVKGGTHVFQGVIGEISDHGFYVTAANSRFIGCRADLNRGHGFVLAANSGGALIGCLALRNSLETTNTYDGFNFANNTRFRVSECDAISLTADSRFHRYGFNDATTGYANYNSFASTNSSNLHATAPISVDNATGSKVDVAGGPFINIAAAATTINVQAYDWPISNYSLNSVGAVNMTDFTSEVTGMQIRVIGDGFTTFVHDGTKIVLLAFANTLAVWGHVYQFVSRGGVWWQV